MSKARTKTGRKVASNRLPKEKVRTTNHSKRTRAARVNLVESALLRMGARIDQLHNAQCQLCAAIRGLTDAQRENTKKLNAIEPGTRVTLMRDADFDPEDLKRYAQEVRKGEVNSAMDAAQR